MCILFASFVYYFKNEGGVERDAYTTKQKEIKKDTAPTWSPDDGSIVLFYIITSSVVIISLSPKDYL